MLIFSRPHSHCQSRREGAVSWLIWKSEDLPATATIISIGWRGPARGDRPPIMINRALGTAKAPPKDSSGPIRGKTPPWIFILLSLYLAVAWSLPARAEEPAIQDTDKVLLRAEDIKALQVRSVKELLNLVPGVKAGDSSVSIRGSYKVRVLLDGLTLNDPGTFSVRLDMVSIPNLQKVEIYKGGGGVSFGDDASGGAVVFTTKRLDKAKVFTELAAGSHDALQGKFNLSRSLERWGIGASGEFKKTSGYRPNNDKEETRLGLRFSYRPEFWDQGREPTLSLDYGQSRKGFAGYPQYPTPNSRGIDETMVASFNWGLAGLKSGSFFTRFEQDRQDTDKDTHTLLRTTSFKQTLSRTWELWGLKGLDTGLNAETVMGEGSELEQRWESSLGLFASKSFKLDPLPFSLGLGLRAIIYSEFKNMINPQADLSYALGIHRFKLAYTQSSNLPSFRQRFFRYSSLLPNPGLGMEKATNLTLSISSKWCKALGSDISFFNREITDRITYVRLDGGVGQYQNFGEVRLRGFEAAIDFKPLKWLSIKPSYTYLEATDTKTGLWLSAKPRHKIKADIRLIPNDKLSLGLFGTYSSMCYTRSDNTESADPYFTLDLRAEYRIGGLTLFTSWKNLFDEQYLYGDGLPAPPRTWLVGVSGEF
jgi:vitamin B12 transporter